MIENIVMKRLFILSIALAWAAIAVMAQRDNAFWRTTISTTGLYGANDEQGNNVIPNVFQQMGFWGTNAFTFVKYDDRYYMIDRKGEMVGGESWDQEPRIYARFAIVGNAGSLYLMDLHGNKLTVDCEQVTLNSQWNWMGDNLMVISKGLNGTLSLQGIDGTLVTSECSAIEPMRTLPLVKYVKKGLTGACNMSGTEIVPCQYVRLEEVNLGTWGKDVELMKKSKVARLYERGELSAMTLIFAYTEAGNVMVYDAAGKPIGPIYDDEGTERILRQLTGNPLVTYLQNKASNIGTVRTQTEVARSSFEQRERAFVNSLPRETAGGMSLLDLTQEKVMQINALRKNDFAASNKELAAKKEQIDNDFSLNKKPRAAAKRTDEVKAPAIKLPAAGKLPDKFELYYASTDSVRAILINGSKTDSYIFSSSSSGGNVITVTIGMPTDDEEGWLFTDEGSNRSVVVAKDWSQVALRTGRTTLYFALPITQRDYELIKANEGTKTKKRK